MTSATDKENREELNRNEMETTRFLWEDFLQDSPSPMPHYLGRALGVFKLAFERELGINSLTVRILLMLKREDGLSQHFLTNFLQVDPSMITRSVKELESKHGWIRRERDPQDNRVVRVYLTEAGRAQIKGLPEKAASIERRVTSRFSPEELNELRRLLHKLLEAARDEQEDKVV